MFSFRATLDIIGVNPFVFVPDEILEEIFRRANKTKGYIPIYGELYGKAYKQTLVKFCGAWRLYVNTTMLKNSPKHVGELVEITLDYDPESRDITPPDNFVKALANNKEAKLIFDQLTASRKLEIVRYLAKLKSEEALEKNIVRAINFLLGKERFIGRYKP